MLAAVHNFSFSMGPTASLALHVAIGGYFIAALLALAALLLPNKVKMSAADIAGAASTLALGVFFGARFFEAGTAPLGGMFEIVALTALFLSVTYLVASRLKPMPGVGAFAYPALAIIFLADFLLAPTFAESGPRGPEEPLLVVHIVLILLSYGVYLLAAAGAIMYLLQERQIKLHKDPRYMRSFPPLESLKNLVNTCVQIGLPLLTLGFGLGFVAFSADDWANVARNPKVLASLVLWLVLVGVYVGRMTGLLHGRRHFYWVLVGFVLVILTYVGLGLLVTRAPAPKTQTAEVR
jgi:ABC-type uncharacterized transport system permease subunit